MSLLVDVLISSKSPTAVFSKMKIEDAKMKNEVSLVYKLLPAESKVGKQDFRLSRFLSGWNKVANS